MNTIIKAALVAIVLNLVLPFIVSPIATDKEKNACIKDTELNLKEKFMVMLLHHKHMPIMSSAIVALVLTVSVILAERI